MVQYLFICEAFIERSRTLWSIILHSYNRTARLASHHWVGNTFHKTLVHQRPRGLDDVMGNQSMGNLSESSNGTLTYHSGAYVYTHTQMIIKTKYTKSSKYIRILNNNAYHSITHTFSLILLLTHQHITPMHNYCSIFSISINANKSIINLYCPIFLTILSVIKFQALWFMVMTCK